MKDDQWMRAELIRAINEMLCAIPLEGPDLDTEALRNLAAPIRSGLRLLRRLVKDATSGAVLYHLHFHMMGIVVWPLEHKDIRPWMEKCNEIVLALFNQTKPWHRETERLWNGTPSLEDAGSEYLFVKWPETPPAPAGSCPS